jgi:hypothetical protein
MRLDYDKSRGLIVPSGDRVAENVLSIYSRRIMEQFDPCR